MSKFRAGAIPNLKTNLKPNLRFKVKVVPGTHEMLNSKFLRQKGNWFRFNRSPLQRAGLLTRSIMRRSIRKDHQKGGKRRVSRPGKPPKSRAPGHPFKLIYSVLNEKETYAVVGHEKFKHTGLPHTPMNIHERGGRHMIYTWKRFRKKAQSKAQAREARRMYQSGELKPKGGAVGMRMITFKRFEPRPFALPAVTKAATKIPKLWKNSVKSSTVKT